MRGLGFEPRNALSNDGLNVARLTTPASPHSRGFEQLSCFKLLDLGDGPSIGLLK